MKNFYPVAAAKTVLKYCIILPAFLLVTVSYAFAGKIAPKNKATKGRPAKGTAFTAPVVTYNANNTFTAGVSITSLTPTSTSVDAPGFIAGNTLAGPFLTPYGVAIDASGNIYYCDQGTHSIKKTAANGTGQTTYATGITTPTCIAIDKAGNIFVGDATTQSILKIPANTGIVQPFANGFNEPDGVAVDTLGNIYVADRYNNAVKKISANGNSNVSIGGTFGQPVGVAVDASGNVYVADMNSNSVKMIPATGGATKFWGTASNPWAIAVDNAGTVYVSNISGSSIQEIPVDGSVLTVNTGGLVKGIAVNNAGKLVLCEPVANQIQTFVPNGGYFINAPLPAGLKFSTTTGIVSGKPLSASIAKKYTVTAYNNTGASTTAGFVIKVVLPVLPTLSYTTPNLYNIGATVNLSPAGRGSQAFEYSAPVVIGSQNAGFRQPLGVMLDPAGNLYVCDGTLTSLMKIPAGGGTPVPVGHDLAQPYQSVMDAAGNIYVADFGHSVIKKIFPDGNIVSLGSGQFSRPNCIAIDAAGTTLYIGDFAQRKIKKMSLDGSSITDMNISVAPLGVAINSSNQIFVSNSDNNNVDEYAVDGSFIKTNIFNGPRHIAIDNGGNLYVTSFDQNVNIVAEISADGNSYKFIREDLNQPYGIAIDSHGKIYIGDSGSGTVKQLTPVGGYFSTKPLPIGLILNNSTGVINGITINSYPATVDSIITYNAAGSIAAPLSLEVRLYTPATVSYRGVTNYTVGFPVTPLAPISTNVSAPAYSVVPTTIASAGFNSPNGVAVDKKGNIYIADNLNNVVKKIPAGGGQPVIIGGTNEFSEAFKVGVDSVGNVYVDDYNHKAIKVIPANGSAVYILKNLASQATSMAVDAGGNVYVLIYSSKSLYKIHPDGFQEVLAVEINNASGIGVDASGNVYVGDYLDQSILKVPAIGGPPVTVATGLSFPDDIAVDNAGNIFVTDKASKTITRIDVNGNKTQIASSATLGTPTGVTVDGAGNIYFADNANNAIKKVSPIGGYFISPALPKGLNFSTFSGIISGVPAVASPATTYTVNAWNNGGATSTTISSKSTMPALPTVSYRGPHTYGVSASVSLAPTSTNVAAPGNYNVPVNVATGFTHPYGVVIDKAGNTYVASGDDYIVKLAAGTGVATALPVGSGLIYPQNIALDQAGNIYIACSGDNSVKKMPAGGGAAVNIATGVFPYGIAVDTTGNIFISNTNTNQVMKMAKGASSFVNFSQYKGPRGLAIATDQSVLVTDVVDNTVSIATGGAFQFPVSGGLNYPIDVKEDANRFVYVADQNNNGIQKVDLANVNAPNKYIGYVNNPSGLALTPNGTLYVTSFLGNSLQKIAPSGGYTIYPALPPGLTMDSATGIISGNPTTTTPHTDYTITAYNAAGSASAVVNIRTTGKPVTLSYTNPNNIPVNTRFSQTPSSSGVSAFGFNTTTKLIAAGFDAPNGVFVDVKGNTYVTAAHNSYITKYLANSTDTAHIGSVNFATDVVADTLGNIYVTEHNNAVTKITTDGVAHALANINSYPNPNGIALDGQGNVYFTDLFTQGVYKVSVNGGTVTSVGSGWIGPFGIKVDTKGTIYVANYAHNSIQVLASGATTPVLKAYNFQRPTSLTLDPGGNIYVCDAQADNVTLIPADGTANKVIGSGFGATNGIGVDLEGNVVVADYTGGQLKKITPNGGYFLDKFLPVGLTFDNNTGVIGGTPTKVTPAKDYRVIAYNATDSASFKVKIGVNSGAQSTDATLYSLTTTAGNINPAFDSGTLAYTASVGNSVTSITVTPQSNNANATIKVNGAVVSSGNASGNIALAPGANVINTVVTAQDGSTVKTYKLTVTRAASAEAHLANIQIAGATLNPAFTSAQNIYTATLASSTPTVAVTPTATDPDETITVNGTVVASGASINVSLGTGATVITIIAKASNGTTTKTYKVTVTQAAVATDATLSGLALSAGTLSPAFAPGTTTYTEPVANGSTSITVTPTTTDAGATVKVNGITVSSGHASASIALAVGANIINTVVTAADGTTIKTYKVTVTRATSAEAHLSNLVLSAGTLSPAFTSAQNIYTATVGSTVATIKVTPTATDPDETITVNGTATASGSASANISLSPGSNVITIVATASNGTTAKTYKVTVTRSVVISSDATLSGLAVSTGTISPVFASATTGYTESVTNAITSIVITPTANDAGATIKVKGVTVASGHASAAINLVAGSNPINTIVTAADGTTKNYTITVTRAPSAEAHLSNIVLSDGTLSPVFTSAQNIYTASVSTAVATIKVTATATDPDETLTLNGVTIESGLPSSNVTLVSGSNVLTIVATASNGTTTKTYKVTVTRASSVTHSITENSLISTDNTANSITVHPAVSPNGDGIDDYFRIDGIENYADNTVSIISSNGAVVYHVTGYNNTDKAFSGRSNSGTLQKPGTYFYQLKYTDNGELKTKTGYLVIKY